MKKLIPYLTTILFIFGSCKKAGNTYTPPQQNTPIGGYGLGSITGLFNITLLKNSDTTIVMPITVYVYVYGNWNIITTINYGLLPADVVSLTPVLFSSSATGYVTDSVAFQIHAVDTGTFPITVFANCSGENASDSFNIIVH